MPEFLKVILASGLVKARVMKAINGASMAAGGWALTSTYVFITTHFHTVSTGDATAIASTVSLAVAGLVLTIGSAIYSQFDATKVDAKITTAAVTGSVQAANDPNVRAAVVAAAASPTITAPSGSPEALAQLKASLAAGIE